MNELVHIDDAELLPQGSQTAWSRARARIRANLGEDVFSAYCAGLKLEQILGDTAFVSVSSSFNHRQVTGPYFEPILAFCKVELPGVAKLKIVERKLGEPYQPVGLAPNRLDDAREAEEKPAQVAPHPVSPQIRSDPISSDGFPIYINGQGVEFCTRDLQNWPRLPAEKIRLEAIIQIVCRHYKVSRTELMSEQRPERIVRPRQVCMYIAKKLTSFSLPQIGKKMGGRDHTTVLHSIRKIEVLMSEDADFKKKVESLIYEVRFSF